MRSKGWNATVGCWSERDCGQRYEQHRKSAVFARSLRVRHDLFVAWILLHAEDRKIEHEAVCIEALVESFGNFIRSIVIGERTNRYVQARD